MKGQTMRPGPREYSRLTRALAAAVMVAAGVAGLVALAWWVSGATPG